MFVKGEKGKLIPLDKRAVVYEVRADMMGEEVAVPIGERYVSHFATCTDPARFSKARKR
jgi:hypothetical protein